MQNRVTYEFAVIRVVPKVEREEFINIGVILFSKPKKYLGLKYFLDENRLLSFAPDLELDLIRGHLRAWQQVCDGRPEGGAIAQMELPYRFRWLTAKRSTIIQNSQAHPGLCEDPESELNALFDLYVKLDPS